MMTREKMLERAEMWLSDAEGDGDRESRYIALADAWIRLAAEVRKGGAPVSPDVN
jgi:hypothetical protein